MAYVPTTFVDRAVEFPNRRKLTAVPGQADTFDVERAEGTVFAEGTKPDAANLNAEFGHVKTELDTINASLPYINAADVIATLVNGTLYTATEDCIISGTIGRDTNGYYTIEIDGVFIGGQNPIYNYANNYIGVPYQMPLKAGHTIKITVANGGIEVKAYGLL